MDASGGEMRRWGGPLRVYIDGENGGDGHRPIPHLATFASRLAGRWTCIMDLVITGAVCRARDLDLDAVFRDLAAFSITNLYLIDVIFPSILTLGRLVCALPSLKVLCLWNVQFAQHPRDASNISHFRLLPRTQLDTLVLGHRSDDTELRPSFVELASPWSAVRALQLGNVMFPSVTTFARLLCALPALESLELHGSCTFVKHGFDLRSVPTDLGLPSQLADVDFGRHSEPRSVAALVDFFISTGLTHKLRRITCFMSPILWVTTKSDAVLDRLIKYSAQSLHHRSLQHVELGKVLDGLPQLDAIFSRPIFNNLTDVHVHIRTPDGSYVRDEELAHDLRLCLPMLDARGILRCVSLRSVYSLAQ
ncbi:hypothetical protein IEO21_09939 [Rhodonia placenta]|uniref:F-box domain-containing protein n=1 Tax=Rhodonia placenta TaxID=104341 RepID=A0A8H7TY01_9APHY|nr:hypothetical protein IEO21_09939 [Postia placenta]